jgi:hypothetical protein
MDLSDYKTVATVVRVEFDQQTGEMYLVFLVNNEGFKKSIEKNWSQDVDFIIKNKSLEILERE